jgi:tRNA(Arg) A34 adenosine deaminase TadA
MNHDHFLRAAIRLADAAVTKGNQPFGSVLVRAGEIILEAENTIHTGGDLTNHAEMNLVRIAAQKYSPEFLHECSIYASTEPCAMCAGAIYWSGIGKVIYACSSGRLYDLAGPGLMMNCREIMAKGSRKVDVIGPLLEEEAVQSHLHYWHK